MSLRLGWAPTVLLLASCGGTPIDADASVDAADAALACRANADCDNGSFCDGVETCVASRCVPGARVVCTDGVACTVDACSEEQARCVFRVPDVDGDGHGTALCRDGTNMPLGDDCDDTDPARFPGNHERCDAQMHDEDCDPSTHGAIDADGDGFEDARCCNGTGCGDDCDDAHESAHPGATEVCNLVDDDCDTHVDEGVGVSGFVDADHDGFGDASMPLTACGSAAGFAADGTDCDDTRLSRNPAQLEICDGLDNDCDTRIDEATSPVTWYRDVDGDGFGSAASGTTSSCMPPSGYSLRDTDCNDASVAISPGSAETCNGIDDDCNGVADFVIAPGDLEDDDRDGIADLHCGLPRGLDCDDRDASSAPGTAESCDGRDNDCDGRIDEGATEIAFYRDVDGDGYGDPHDIQVACSAPSGYVRRGGDCDDTSAMRGPGAIETCNAIDDDCDVAVDEGSASASCHAPNSVMACVGGLCVTAACTPNFGDCDPAVMGCETDVLIDPDHCGSCTACAQPVSSCRAGICGPTTAVLTALESSAGAIEVERLVSLPATTDYVALGRFTGTVHFGTTTLTSLGGYDGFAARLHRDHTVAWAYQWGGTGNDAIHAAASTADGLGFVVGGELCGANLCGGPIAGCIGFYQRFVSAAAGGCNYADGIAGTTASIRALAMEHVGATYIIYGAGTWTGVGGHSVGTSMGQDAFVFRAHEVTGMQPVYDWTRSFTGQYDDVVEDLAIDGANHVAVVGYTAASINFGLGVQAHAGYDDAIVAVLNRTSGAVITSAEFGTASGDDHAQRVVFAPSGDVVLSGYFSGGTLTIGGSTITAGGTGNPFVVSVSPATLATRWSGHFAASGPTVLNGLGVAGSSVVVAGSFLAGLAFMHGVLPSNGQSALLMALDQTTGDTVFARGTDGGSDDASGGVAVGSDGLITWEIQHSGPVTFAGTTVGATSLDAATVVVTP